MNCCMWQRVSNGGITKSAIPKNVMRLARCSAGVRSRYGRLCIAGSRVGVCAGCKHMRSMLDTAISRHHTNNIDQDTSALNPEPRPLSGINRGEIEVRPDRIDREIEGKTKYKLGHDAGGAQHRSHALCTRDR